MVEDDDEAGDCDGREGDWIGLKIDNIEFCIYDD
jgi:hypothetical protein